MIRQGLVLLLVVAATIIGWRLLDGEIDAATVEGPLHGVTYAPWAKDQDPIEAKASGVYSFLRTAFTDTPPPAVKPRKEQIERDFAMLAGKVNYVRTYRTSDGGEVMPEIAARNGLKLVPGAWIYSANEAKQQFGRDAGEVNAEETRALIRMANQNPNIERVLVGNENILRWDAQKDLRDPNATARPSSSARSGTSSATSRCRSAPPSRGTSGCTIRSSRARSTISPSTCCPTGTSSRANHQSTISRAASRC